MHHARPCPVRAPVLLLATLLLAPALPAQIIWNSNPTDSMWSTASNWSTGTVPGGTSTVIEFGASSLTFVTIDYRLLIGTLRFNATAAMPYTLNFTFTGGNSTTTIRLGSIVNNSSWAPTLFFKSTNVSLASGGSLANANLNLSFTDFYFNGLGGTATISMNSGTLYYARAGGTTSGENARLILNGTLSAASFSDTANLIFGSIEGSGTITLYSDSTLTVGGNNRDATFSGTIGDGNPSTSRTITKVGSGTWTLASTNSSDAAITVSDGTLAVDSDTRLGTGGALTLNGGTLRATASFDGLRALVLGSGGGTLDTQGYSVTQTGGLSGSGLFTKAGSGSLTLGAAGTSTGGVMLSAGTLVVGDNNALGTGALTLAGGALAASGTRSFANAVTLNADTTVAGSSALTSTGAWTLAASRSLTITNSALTTIAGVIGESGGPRALLKTGAGTLELTGANTYTGGTLVAEGTVRINNSTGSAFGPGAVTVASGATLTGAGSFTGAFQNNGIYAPGNSPTLETLSSFVQGSTGILEMELGGLDRGTGYDALDVTGSASFDGTLEVTFYNGFTAAVGNSFDLIDWGSASGTFATVNLPTLGAGLSWDASQLYTSGELSVIASPIPEPSTYAIMAGMLALAGTLVRRRRLAAP